MGILKKLKRLSCLKKRTVRKLLEERKKVKKRRVKRQALKNTVRRQRVKVLFSYYSSFLLF